ncbi:hypothetical protein C8J57DRAFT_1222743 [Mycena rebaudengoi]|nr:hypothetical protein C8J57DRAFT_1222743 [Mycena rebaudengoi]
MPEKEMSSRRTTDLCTLGFPGLSSSRTGCGSVRATDEEILGDVSALLAFLLAGAGTAGSAVSNVPVIAAGAGVEVDVSACAGGSMGCLLAFFPDNEDADVGLDLELVLDLIDADISRRGGAEGRVPEDDCTCDNCACERRRFRVEVKKSGTRRKFGSGTGGGKSAGSDVQFWELPQPVEK